MIKRHEEAEVARVAAEAARVAAEKKSKADNEARITAEAALETGLAAQAKKYVSFIGVILHKKTHWLVIIYAAQELEIAKWKELAESHQPSGSASGGL